MSVGRHFSEIGQHAAFVKDRQIGAHGVEVQLVPPRCRMRADAAIGDSECSVWQAQDFMRPDPGRREFVQPFVTCTAVPDADAALT